MNTKKERNMINFLSSVSGRLEAMKELADDEVRIGNKSKFVLQLSIGIDLLKKDVDKKLHEVL
jgi:hypothetical protein